MAEQPFEPGFLRPQPPLYHSEDEAIWLNPTQSQCPIQWDTLMCSHSATGVLFMDTLLCHGYVIYLCRIHEAVFQGIRRSIEYPRATG